MGISMTVYSMDDATLARLRQREATLDPACKNLLPKPSETGCYLSSNWRHINELLTEGQRSPSLPLAALTKGDFDVPGISDGAHAVLSRTARKLDFALDLFDEARIREFLERERVEAAVKAEEKGPKAAPYLVWRATQKASESVHMELWAYLGNLKTVVKGAAEMGQGLLFVRWEDW